MFSVSSSHEIDSGCVFPCTSSTLKRRRATRRRKQSTATRSVSLDYSRELATLAGDARLTAPLVDCRSVQLIDKLTRISTY